MGLPELANLDPNCKPKTITPNQVIMMIQTASDNHKTVAAPISRLHSINTSQLIMPARGAALENGQNQQSLQDHPFRLNIIKAKRKDAIERQKISNEHTKRLLKTHQLTADHIGQPTKRPLEPQSALRFPYETAKLLSLLLAVSMFISLVGGVLAFDDRKIEVERVAHSSRGKLKTNYIHNNNRNRHSDRGLGRPHGSQHLHRSTGFKQKDEDEQQHQLRYLIARTASIPQLADHDQLEPLHKRHHERYQSHASHTDNNIVNYHDQKNHHNPKSVQQRTRPEPSVASAARHNQNHNLFLEQARLKSTNLQPELSSLNHPNSHYYDFDSLDVDLDDEELDDDSNDSDDNEKATDDDDDDDVVVDDGDDDGIDLNVGASSDIDAVRGGSFDGSEDEDESDDEDDQVEANNSESAMHSENASDNSLDQRGPHSRRVVGKKYRGDEQAKILYSRPGPATTAINDGHPHGAMKLSKESNTTDKDYRLVQSESSLGQTLGTSNWTKDHDDESFSDSDDMVMPTVLSKQEASSEPISHLEGKSIQPLAPYQSPVVVSISDNSFVSASPITMSSDTEALANLNQRRLEETPVRYSRIIASPRNELSLHAKRHWHESHIQMIQEDPDELRKGNINSAIIAILFGIGATGMLIMIVSVKMRSIRERVAYKGRRRSLVPDTDFLINTIPI